VTDTQENQHGHGHGHGHIHGDGDPNSPRRTGKLHYHEEEVRPIQAAQLIHRQPHLDLYADADRKHPGRDVDLPLRTIQLHIGKLEPGQSTRLHKHHNEAAIYIIEGNGHSELQGKSYPWEKGDFIYIPSMQWHTHVNSGDVPVLYMGITNKRMLDWLGLDRKVEAGVHVPMEEVEKEIASDRYSPYSHYNITPETGVRFGPEGFITHGD
jgi:mannose-6-phosphate isomerase-like protein (cupin superfamily)